MVLKFKKQKFGIFLIAVLLLILTSFFVSAIYTRAYVQNNPFTLNEADVKSEGTDFRTFDSSMCRDGQDFVLNVLPFGCDPVVVRSDLLEEQDVTVYCKISATQINPLIEVNAIDNIHIGIDGNYPKEVSTVGYFPARAALGRFGSLQINQPVLENIGYAAITLRRNPNESSMPDFVEGNLTARMRYDIDKAFGIGRSTYYLPEFSSDSEFQNRRNAYSFWNGRGYLRAEGITNEGAVISVYSGRSVGSFSGGEPRKIANLNLRERETSSEVFMPSFNFCQGGLTVTLKGVENPDTRARFNVNGNYFEVKEEEKFLDEKCSIGKGDIGKRGLNQKVSLNCRVDEGDRNFDLIIAPEVDLVLNGNTERVSLGDKLYDGEEGKSVYLAHIGTKKKIGGGENTFVSLVAIPEHRDRLSKNQLDSMAGYIKRYDSYEEFTGIAAVDVLANFYVFAYGRVSESIFRDLVQGETFESFIVGEGKEFYGTEVTFSGFAGAQNIGFGSSDIEQNYNSAKSDYEEIINSFSEERYPDPTEDESTLGEQAFRNLIELANGINQKQDVLIFCSEFEEIYSEVDELPSECTDSLKLSNRENSVNEVLIGGKVYRISLEGIKEPSFNELGVRVTIRGADDDFSVERDLTLNEKIFVSETEFITLKDLEYDYAVFDVSSIKKDTLEKLTYSPKNLRISLNDYQGDIGVNNYRIEVNDINLKKVARVSVDPSIRNAVTTADFNFKVGIDKRAIQLSPEKINEKLQSTTERLEKLQGFQSKLEPVVEGFETACKATSLALTLKTFLTNLDGEGIARQEVMRGEEGWFDKCRDEVENEVHNHGNIDSCLLAHNDKIGNAVGVVKEGQDRINQEMKLFQEGITKTSFLGEDVVNTTALIKKCVDGYQEELNANLANFGTVKIGTDDVDASEILGRVNKDTVSITQCRDLQLYSRLLSEGGVVGDIAKQKLKASLNDIYINTNAAVERTSLAQKYGFKGATSAAIGEISNRQDITSEKVEIFRNIEDQFTLSPAVSIEGDEFVTIFRNTNNGREYLLTLTDGYDVSQTYFINPGPEKLLTLDGNEDDVNTLNLAFEYFDAATYENPFDGADYKVRYYESGNYKGLPAIVPFDKENGWYASVKSTLPVFGNIRSFDDSGRVSSFYLCNVGKNHKAEFNSGFGDDDCQGINLGTGQPYNVFPGLSITEASKQINRAVLALKQASEQHSPGIQSVRITIPGLPTQNIPVGEPAVNIPDIQCQDFMSPFECNLLFNACDPIICPSSRCDFGGAYPVADVVQSGIGGSLLLCLPNFPDVIVPICLSGVQAGLQGWESVLESYQQCLQTSSDTGQTVGICDEINSVYQCDLLWRQVAPISEIVVPKLVGAVLGQNVRGGGEYLGAADAFDRAKNSADFYRNYYTDNANAAFRARNLQETAVGAVCRNSLSAIYPGAEVFDNLISADSPPQFYGRFDEIPFTTVTNPPTSQYKVFYHIFAGKDFGASYQVYLKGSGGSFFQDTLSRRIVASDFIPAGGYHTDAADFTAPSGYNQMCIVVNGQEECGFKEVTTEFAFTYVRDQYVKGQLEQTEITSERECISGTLSAYSLLNPNIQAGAEDFIDPQIYNQGITRICATNSPGKGSDSGFGTESARWRDVGNCGSEGLTCWLDKKSIQNAVESFHLEDELLEDFKSKSLDTLNREGDQYGERFDNFEDIDEEIKSVEDEPLKVIELVDEVIDKVFFNSERAYLHLLRGNAFGSLAKSFLAALPSPQDPDAGGDGATGVDLSCSECGQGGFPDYCDREECEELGCEFVDGFLTNNGCIAKTELTSSSSSQPECNSLLSCREILGAKIVEIAGDIKDSREGFNDFDAQVKTDTGVESFECLVLQVAFLESGFQQCGSRIGVGYELNGNPLYCDNDLGKTLSGPDGGSLGIMQINRISHPTVDVTDFEVNVRFGINHLIDNDDSDAKTYVCTSETYSGWRRALRGYNGWSVDSQGTPVCYNNDGTQKGNPNYVEDVIRVKEDTDFLSLFPECEEGYSSEEEFEGIFQQQRLASLEEENPPEPFSPTNGIRVIHASSGESLFLHDFSETDLCKAGTTCELEEGAYVFLSRAQEIAESQGVSLVVTGGYRTEGVQYILWDRNPRLACGPNGGTFSHCPHVSGKAVDIRFEGKFNTLNTGANVPTSQNTWEMNLNDWELLEEIMLEAGWIGLDYEQWHFECCGTSRYLEVQDQDRFSAAA